MDNLDFNFFVHLAKSMELSIVLRSVGLSRRISLESYRMAAPYQLLYLPWYSDSSNLSE